MPCGAGRSSPVSRTSGLPRRSEEHTSELQSQSNLVCRLLLEKKKIEEQISANLERSICDSPVTEDIRRSEGVVSILIIASLCSTRMQISYIQHTTARCTCDSI